MRKNRKRGFTLTELIVVLVVMAVIAAIGIPTAYHYIKKAEFRKNEANAKTVYMAAETMMTYYRSSKQWEEFKEDVMQEGMQNTSFSDEDEKQNRIYAITLDRGAYSPDSENLVCRLLDDLTYDANMLESGAISIEIDVETGQVYSAFYATRCRELTYDEEDSGDSRTMHKRDYKSRSKRLVGYYSVEDVANVVDLTPAKLKITSVNLVNGETLSLNWSSNSRHNNLDVRFLVNIYQKAADKNSEDQKLFSTTVNLWDLRKTGWSGNQEETASMAFLKLTNKDDTEDTEEIETGSEWAFPLTYENGTISLVLDAMMSADAQAYLEDKSLMAGEKQELAKTSSTSIRRLAQGTNPVAPLLDKPQDIYATVQAEATYENMQGDEKEYQVSAAVSSNSANTLYADKTKTENGKLEAKINTFRHLSNMRYYDDKVSADFVLTNKKLDWHSVGVGMYVPETVTIGRDSFQKLCWKKSGDRLEFPSIAHLPKKHTFYGEAKTAIANLRLGTTSVIPDTAAAKLGAEYTEYAGLFCELEGTVRDLTLENPYLVFAGDDAGTQDVKDYAHIKGVGILAGRSEGLLRSIKIKTKTPETQILTVRLPDRESGSAGTGGIAGVLAAKDKNGNLIPIEGTAAADAKAPEEIDSLEVSGVITAKIPKKAKSTAGDTEAEADVLQGGIGGVAGYVRAGHEFVLKGCKNYADVSGNMLTGGLCGHIEGTYNLKDEKAAVVLCSNEGLILCTTPHTVEENNIEGRYFGGIIGFGQKVLLDRAESTSGRSSNFQYTESRRPELLKGQYVGGIMGFGTNSRLQSCKTGRNGYILGSDYVGGIVGGMEKGVNYQLLGGTTATVNAGYVIGNTYVGGIVGYNEEGNVIEECVNNGVAAGYNQYIGGIVGYNGKGATIKNCASYLSDYNNSIYNMIVNTWKATGDCTGGLAGYNNGMIDFDASSEKLTVNSVSSIVAGKDYVGGVIGFNDTEGTMKTEYKLISGRVYASGDCAGGCVGFNASPMLFRENIVMKPQSVQGNYYVGGFVGANVLELTTDITADKISSENALGKVTAEAFAGGVIGYQRTYTSGQLADYNDTEDSLYEYIKEGRKYQLLPELDANTYIPKTGEGTGFISSNNRRRMLFTKAGNTKDNAALSSNNMTIQAQAFAGGIVGGCEKNSKLVIYNCRNTGELTLKNADKTKGVDLKAYLSSQGFKTAAENVYENQTCHMIGGIIGVNQQEQVIDHCFNSGNMTQITGLGGIVGLNAGGVFNCELSKNFGNAALDAVGGIAGYNVGIDQKEPKYSLNYLDVKGNNQSYMPGIIANSSCSDNVTVSGHTAVGGIAGYNLPNGVLKDNSSDADVTASGNAAGGIAGRNAGDIFVKEDTGKTKRTISGRNGEGIGGIAGYNESSGVITLFAAGTGRELTAIGPHVYVYGGKYVGGIVGINDGSFYAADNQKLVCSAAEVRAYQGNAGGIAGDTAGKILHAVNRSTTVSADTGSAGGIVPENHPGAQISDCENQGNVSSSDGYAGGITARNYGIIRSCTTVGKGIGNIEIESKAVEECGAITAVNEKGGQIYDSVPEEKVSLKGSGTVFGGIAGCNYGDIYGSDQKPLVQMPQISGKGSGLSVGGAAGRNEAGAKIENLQAQESFLDFKGYRYLGGIAGENCKEGSITGCRYQGTMTEAASAAGNCYGGIAGYNAGQLADCGIPSIKMTIKGTYTATSTSTAEQKEEMASHVGAVAGKNEELAAITDCWITNDKNSSITAASGMVGGIAGYNKGRISASGDKTYAAKIQNCANIEDMSNAGTKTDSTFVAWTDAQDVENLSYNNGTAVTANRMRFIVSDNGNLGGITAYNAPTGRIERCASGNWYLNNKSSAIGVGTGGIIGMNESEKDQTFLLNQAFVGRQIGKKGQTVTTEGGKTDRYAGGIIGNQNNTTKSGWRMKNCVNYGTVYCYKAHYSGGILGQWTGTGGTIENCRNYGNLQTTYATGWRGASGGIVAQLYHAQEENDYNIISCGNFGSIYGRSGESTENSANDSAGILGNVTNYSAAQAVESQSYTIRVLDCVNGPGVKIYSNSMASGIVGFFSCDSDPGSNIINSTANTGLIIERCRNFAQELNGSSFVGGIFGDRYGSKGISNTRICDNFSVNPDGYSKNNYPVISLTAGSSKDYRNDLQPKLPSADEQALQPKQPYRNYYFEMYGTSFTDLGLEQDSIDTTEGEGSAGGVAYKPDNSDLRYANTERVYVMKNRSTGKYVLVEIYKDHTVNPYWATIVSKTGKFKTMYTTIDAEAGDIVSKDYGKKDGRVLCELDTAKYGSVNDIIKAGNPYYSLVRGRYRSIEGLDASGTKLLKPKLLSAELIDGRLYLDIEPYNDHCDPFKYKVMVNGTVLDEVLYSETGSIAIPAEMGSKPSVAVCAVSMFDDVTDSDWSEKGTVETQVILPKPEIRAELIKSGTNYRYKFSLENQEDYKAYNKQFQISVKFTDGTALILDEIPENPLKEPYAALIQGKTNIQQIIAQAEPKGEGVGKFLESEVISVPAYMPDWKPPVSLSGTTAGKTVAKVTSTVSGTTMDNLAVTVNLDAGQTDMISTPPIYRVELVGTWKKDTSKTVVFDSRDVLISAKGEASAVFTNLADYLRNASDMKVRVWYAESGLGPVYTWHEVSEVNNANVYVLTDVTEETESWEYFSSTVVADSKLGGNRRDADYLYTSGTLFNWLAVPELLNVTDGEGGLLVPQYKDGRLCYTFYWDRANARNFDESKKYTVKLYGITDEDGSRVAISAGDAGIKVISDDVTGTNQKAYSLTVDADEWTYKKVEIEVTRIGDNKNVGLTSKAAFPVRQRLPRPSAPFVENLNDDELDYDISWAKIEPETGCSSYEVSVRQYDADKAVWNEPEVLQTVEAKGQDTYKITQAMDDYAGKTVQIYVTAIAEKDSKEYVNSGAGLVTEKSILERINKPEVAFKVSWTHDPAVPLTMQNYRDGDRTSGLNVDVTAQNAESIPQGGNGYLLCAYVYDTEEAAKAAIDAGNIKDYLDAYPANESGEPQPVEMDSINPDNSEYEHTMKNFSTAYAGKWLVLKTRISAGGGYTSSPWVIADEPFQLPYVKLDDAEPGSATTESKVTAKIQENPQLPWEDREWTAHQLSFDWDTVEHADTCYISIKEKSDASGNAAEHKLRIHETQAEKDGQMLPAITVDQQMWTQEKGTYWETVQIIFPDMQGGNEVEEDLHCYEKELAGNYSKNNTDIPYTITLFTKLRVKWNADKEAYHYTLLLPDTTNLTDEDVVTVLDSGSKFSDAISFIMDVWENEAGNADKPSDAYVGSEGKEIAIDQ